MTDVTPIDAVPAYTATPTAVRPLTAAERLPVVDALRGVAILGVLVAYTMWNLGTPPAATWSRADHAIDATLETLVDAKFITLFAFLFGAGTAQQWRRIAARGADVVAMHVRRMAFLLAVGLLHAALLRNGDILAPYALLGLALLAVRAWPARRIAVAAVVLAILPYVLPPALRAAGVAFPDRPSASADDLTWRSYLVDNLAWLRYWYLTGPIVSWPRVLALMLAGVLADRAAVLPRLAADRRLAWRTLGIALPAAVATRLAVELVAMPGALRTQTYFLSAWSLAAVYVAAFALLCARPGWPQRLAWLRAVGRMAFTNYLVQALLVVPACLALGLFDTVTPTRGVALALAVAAVEIPLSVWWLRRFAYGPVEWLWRRATYGARPG